MKDERRKGFSTLQLLFNREAVTQNVNWFPDQSENTNQPIGGEKKGHAIGTEEEAPCYVYL